MYVLAVAQQKGGVGKTTSVANLAATFAMSGHRVLCVDCDPQGSLTLALGHDPTLVDRTIGEAMLEGQNLPCLSTNVPNLNLCPSTRALADTEFALAPRVGRERFLSKVLSTVESDFDLVFLDTPPSLGLLTVNCLAAAQALLVPVTPAILSAAGMRDLLATVEEIRIAINPQLHLAGVFVTFADTRSIAGRRTESELREDLGNLMFETTISRRIAHEYATQGGTPAVALLPQEAAAQEYQALTAEIQSRLAL